MKGQTHENSGDYTLAEIGGGETNISVGFLDKAVLTIAGQQITNDHADCQISFKIIFHAFQAFLPYEQQDIGSTYLNQTDYTRSPTVIFSDLGTPKPLTIGNSRRYFRVGFSAIYEGITGAIY